MASVTVTTTAGQALAATGNRSGFIMQNQSDTDMFVGKSATVSNTGATLGYKLAAGQSLAIGSSEVRLLSAQAAWYAIHYGSGDKVLCVIEL